MFSNVYIYGLGMMGGSLAKSIKKKNLAKNIYGFDINHKNLIFAKKNKIIDYYDNNFKYLSNEDLIIICAAISKYKSIFRNISKNKKEELLQKIEEEIYDSGNDPYDLWDDPDDIERISENYVINKILIKWYTKFDYEIKNIPKLSIENRIDFILENV